MTRRDSAIRVIRVIRWPTLHVPLAPHENPQDIGGPSTPPMLPRSAQDDKKLGGRRARYLTSKVIGAFLSPD